MCLDSEILETGFALDLDLVPSLSLLGKRLQVSTLNKIALPSCRSLSATPPTLHPATTTHKSPQVTPSKLRFAHTVAPMSSKFAEGKSSTSGEEEPPRTPLSSSSSSTAALEENFDDLDLYNDDLDSGDDGGFSSPEGQASPLAINLGGMSKTSDIEISPFPTLAFREEEVAMGGNVTVVFSLPTGNEITQSFGIGQTVQMLKGWLEKEHDLP